jgi:hypothetical protein
MKDQKSPYPNSPTHPWNSNAKSTLYGTNVSQLQVARYLVTSDQIGP